MRYSICQNRDSLRRMKNAHQYRALLKQTATASGRSSAVHAEESTPWHILDAQFDGTSAPCISRAESGIRPLVANRGRVSK